MILKLRAAATTSLTWRRAVFARALGIASNFLFSVVVSRTLGPDQAGETFALMAILVLVATVGRAGADTLILKLVSVGEVTAYRDTRSLRILVVCLSLFLALSMSVVSLSLALSGHSGWAVTVMPLAAASLVPFNLSVFLASLLRARGWIATGVFAELGSATAITTVCVFAHYLIVGQAEIRHVFAYFLLANIATAGWTTLVSRRTEASAYSVPRAAGTGTRLVRNNWRPLIAMCLTASLVYAMTWSPVLVLAFASNASQAAYFTVAARLAGVIALLPAIQTSYMAPRFARLFHEHRIGEISLHARRAALQSFVVAMPFVALFVVLPSQVLQLLFGPPYAEAEHTLRALAIGSILVVMLGQVSQLLLLCGGERTATLIGLASISIGTLAIYSAAVAFGALGVAVIFSTINLLSSYLGSRWLKHRSGIVTGLVGL